MRLEHFETLKPVCPRCRSERGILSPLSVANVEKKVSDVVIEGSLICTDQACSVEYPIIDGVPIIVNQLQKFINENFYYLTVRDDLSSLVTSILGDMAGPGASFNELRHFISTYTWDHYGDMAPDGELKTPYQDIVPGSVIRCLHAGLSLLDDAPQIPAIDIGCAVGRTTFEIATAAEGLVLGIDTNFPVLRLAQQILREGRVSFSLKRVGLVYDYHDLNVQFENHHRVDFWACNAMALPFADETFNFVNALNVIDTVSTPRQLLVSINNLLRSNGSAILSSPYDWSAPTPVPAWVGGHAQRHQHHGDSDTVLKSLLDSGTINGKGGALTMTKEISSQPWDVRIHDRRSVRYSTHIVACQKKIL